MNKSIRKVAAALAVLFVALFVNLNYVQVVKGSSYRDDPNNRRVLLNEYANPRGPIVVDGTDIAKSRATKDELKYLRTYPYGKVYAPITGYYSFVYGTSGIEAAEDSILTGNDNRLFGTRLADLLTGRNPRGGSVDLTINKAAQEAAYSALVHGSNGVARRGAVVALDPTTGAILAAVSTPTFDPNQLSSHSGTAVTKAWGDLQKDDQSALRNRAFNERYPPGSTFKLVVAAAALKAGINPNTDKLFSPNGYYPETGKGTKACPTGSVDCLENFDGEQCDNGTDATLAFALAKSCNTTFAALAVEKLGGTAIADEAKLFGFDATSQLTVPLSVAPSTVGSGSDLTAKGFLARTAFGQQDVAMTPLQGAMLSSAAANNGILMKPYLVQKEVAPDLKTISETQPEQLSQVLNLDQAQALQSMMEGVVTSPEGTGAPARIDAPGVIVAGKTGTADNGPADHPNPPHAWFTGYAAVQGTPRIAVCVLIENGGVQGNETTGGEAAAPVAKAVMEAYLKDKGDIP